MYDSYVVFLILCLGLTFAATTIANLVRGRRVIHPLDFQNVSLYAGQLRTESDEVKDFYLRIPIDDLMHGYRVRAGLPAPGMELGGWYTSDQGNAFPQILSALARFYAATADQDCLEKANAMLNEFVRCIGDDGYYMYSMHPTSKHYYYEKLVGALVDMAVYCERDDALQILSRVTTWAKANLKTDRVYANACGDPENPLTEHAEWYTVAENLYRAYMVTGDAKYLEFGKLWEYPEFWNLFTSHTDVFGIRPNGKTTDSYHAYSHVNSLSSAAAAYLVTGEHHYLTVLKNAYSFLMNGQVFATGGFGPNEKLAPPHKVLEMLHESHDSFETQCGSWAAFKLCKYLMSFTGDASYGDWVERLTLNGIGASLPMSSNGKVTYYSDYKVGGATKRLSDDTWTCCTGTRPQAVADYYDQAFFLDAHSLYVNLFTPSRVRFKVGNQMVAVLQRTRFPDVPETTFRISAEQPARFALKIRIPGWLAEPMQCKLNGNRIAVPADSLHWMVMDRVWREGDKLSFTLPANLWTSRMGATHDAPSAILYGPVVLAFRSADGDLASKINFENPNECLTQVKGERLSFRLNKDPNVLARPYMDFREGEPYTMYFDPPTR